MLSFNGNISKLLLDFGAFFETILKCGYEFLQQLVIAFSVRLVGDGGLASSCATSSVACTLIESSSLLDLRLGAYSSPDDSSEETETERPFLVFTACARWASA